MLDSLYIKNFALIDELNVDFSDGFSIITGETGAGKSILLGGLALVLGKRADLSQVKHKDKKCVIEAGFNISKYNLKELFIELDLDYEDHTIIRREIIPSGKSRAFINDTPATIDSLSKIGAYLVDVHSQHQTLQVTEDTYQFKILDALSDNFQNIKNYKSYLKIYQKDKKTLEQLSSKNAENLKEYDFNTFLYKELKEIQLDNINLETLEEQYQQLTNVEDIATSVAFVKNSLDNEDLGVLAKVNEIKNSISGIINFGKNYQELFQRFESIGIELDDIFSYLDDIEETLVTDPETLQNVSVNLQKINDLFQKHSCSTIEDLIEIRDRLKTKIDQVENHDDILKEAELQLKKSLNALQNAAKIVTDNRLEVIPKLVSQLQNILSKLGMPHAQFKIKLTQAEGFLNNGKDYIQFLFTANKGTDFNELKKAASGGELSRIMLAVKSILASYINLPSIIFDEIDTGVSGEISNKMGEIMKQMSKNMQVFSITHLPQVAAKGQRHYKVFKQNIDNTTQTQLKELNKEEKIIELATMLGGSNITDSALHHAKQLLN